jgi:DNA-binding NarL/FixJ family response regulator
MGLGSKAVAAALGISKNTVKVYLRAHEQAVGDGAPGEDR